MVYITSLHLESIRKHDADYSSLLNIYISTYLFSVNRINLNGDQGQISSPGFDIVRLPPYDPREEIIWTVTVSENKRIQINFLSFELEGRRPTICNYDYIEVNNLIKNLFR